MGLNLTERFDRQAEQLTEIREAIAEVRATLRETCPPCRERIDMLEVALHGPAGNGKHPGITTRLAVVEGRLEELLSSLRWARRWLYGLAAGVLLTIGTILLT